MGYSKGIRPEIIRVLYNEVMAGGMRPAAVVAAMIESSIVVHIYDHWELTINNPKVNR